MPTIVGPFTVADDATPAQVATVQQAIGFMDPRIIALDDPGRVRLSFTKRPKRAPVWAWGYSANTSPDTTAKGWINPDIKPKEQLYTVVHEYGHLWQAKFGTKAMNAAIKPLAIGTFAPDYPSRFAEWFADTFAKATTGKFATVLDRFWKVTALDANYPTFVTALLANAGVPDVPPEPVDPLPPDPPEPDAAQAQIDALIAENAALETKITAAQEALA